jgi:hypothetical protein
MKTILFLTACVLAVGCKKDGASGSASACSDAIAKGVDTMMAAGAKRMEASGGMPAEMKAKMDDAAVKLKQVITNRCTEDKWSAEIVDCYAKATTREDIKSCRAKLPADQSAKLQAEEMQVMSAMMGGMRGPGGMGGPGGPGGMGGMAGMGGHPGALGGSNTGSAAATPPDGSGMAPPAGSAAGSPTK